MRRGNINAHFWSRTTYKADRNDRSSGERRRESERGETSILWRRRSEEKPVSDDSVTGSRQERLPRQKWTDADKPCQSDDSKRHKTVNLEQDTYTAPPSMPCYTNAQDVGRNWYYTRWSRDRRHRANSVPFSVMSYNVLADGLMQAHPGLYEECKEWCLDWEYRKKNLLKEILHCNADILCLQEVESEHFDNWFFPELCKAGYKGFYKKRTGKKSDGCATFYKKSRFHHLLTQEVEFCRKDILVMDRDNVALIVVLRPRYENGKTCNHTALCVANTHLLFNKKRGDIKLLQLSSLFAEIQQVRSKVCSSEGSRGIKQCGVILCGDFNMTPWCPLYSLVVQGFLDYEGMIKTALSGQCSPYRRYNDKDRLCNDIIPRELNLMYDCTWGPANKSTEEENVDKKDTTQIGTNVQCQSLRQTAPTVNLNDWPQLGASLSSVSDTSSCWAHSGKSTIPVTESDPPVLGSSTTLITTAPLGNNSNLPRCPTITHRLNFWSAYNHAHRRGAHEVTTYHGSLEPGCTVDYIFTSGGDSAQACRYCFKRHCIIELRGTLGLLTDEQIRQLGGLPCDKLSSDHLALQASFFLHL